MALQLGGLTVRWLDSLSARLPDGLTALWFNGQRRNGSPARRLDGSTVGGTTPQRLDGSTVGD